MTEITSEDRRVFEDILSTIGMTPLVRLNRVSRGFPCRAYAKLEYFNPGGSIKDRIALNILEAYEQAGDLAAGGTVVEATSGNTGVGLAIACAIRGYQAVFVMPDKMSQEKIQLLRAYGARVVITPTAVAPEDERSYYSVAQRIVDDTPNSVLANQYFNPENPNSHYLTTGPEIWNQTDGKVTHIVIGMGTGGTITGVARYVREHEYPVQIVGVDPVGSLLYDAWKAGGSQDGLEASTYKVEGIGEDFIPGTLDLSLVDQVIQVDDRESFLWTRRLLREEGIFGGGSSGTAMAAAARLAEGLSQDDLIVVIFPDSGSRYLSKVYNDDWMREHGFLEPERIQVSARAVAEARGLPGVITASAEDPLQDVVGTMREHGISQLPVVDSEGHLLGIVSEVELLNHMLTPGHDRSMNIGPLVNETVGIAYDESPLDEVLPALVSSKVIVLIDEERHPTGILTVIDALEYMSSVEE